MNAAVLTRFVSDVIGPAVLGPAVARDRNVAFG